ncbi:SPOR domain-containing protein [Pseudomonas sp. PS02303]|uniref:SPOR domain-containing protein n=1 Tax=Pseudomonas sp. PS02303 TaxID=2991429 RepID=UPI00249CA5D9|nr:SPOR domain-containing protein [Pseudomonas sp. PS02303]
MQRKTLVLAFLVILISGCGPSIEEVSEQTKLSMQEKLNSDENLKKYDLKVRSVTAIHESGNKYKGMADVEGEGENHQVTIDIIADGKSIFWEAKPMAFAFVLRLKPKPLETAPVEPVQNKSIIWSVQVASLSSETTALQLMENLKRAGYGVYRTQSDGKNRIFVGPISERGEADRIRQQLDRDHNLKGFVVRYFPQSATINE